MRQTGCEHPASSMAQDVSIDHGGADVLVAEQVMERPDGEAGTAGTWPTESEGSYEVGDVTVHGPVGLGGIVKGNPRYDPGTTHRLDENALNPIMHCKVFALNRLRLAGEQGFEPRYRGPEPRVLPLDDSPARRGRSF